VAPLQAKRPSLEKVKHVFVYDAKAKTTQKISSGVELATRQSQIPCDVCIDFFDDTLNTLLNVILNVGVAGTCGDVCLKLSNQYEQGICLLLCVYIGFDAFVDLLSNTDLDPIYLCSALDACPMNYCNGTCANITSLEVQPPSGPVRTTFNVIVNLTVHQQTGTGITMAVLVPPPSAQEAAMAFAVLNEGFAPGDASVTIPIQTDWDDWFFPSGVYAVVVDSCGSDCDNQHGVVFDQKWTQLTITNTTQTTEPEFWGECGGCKIAVETILQVGCGAISSVCGPFEPACELVCDGSCHVADCSTWSCCKIHACKSC
jgi:hypothetical protein